MNVPVAVCCLGLLVQNSVKPTQPNAQLPSAQPNGPAVPTARVQRITNDQLLDSLVKALGSRFDTSALWTRVNEVVVANRIASAAKPGLWGLSATEIVTLVVAAGGWVLLAFQIFYQRKDVRESTDERKATDKRTADERAAAAETARQERDELRLLASKERDQEQRNVASERDQLRRDDRRRQLLDALEWFSGKTQRRAIGLAVVSANWDSWPELRDTWVAVLVNQASYLLTGSDQGDSLAERANLEIIMWLLQEDPARIKELGRWQLKDALDKAIESSTRDRPKGGKGLVVDRVLLTKWQTALPRPKNSGAVAMEQHMGKPGHAST